MRDILIVEDGLNERERLTKLFGEQGFSVACAERVSEAEQLLEVEQFRLAILDIGLSDKSGSYLFEKLKRDASVPYIIILTGNPSVHLKQRFLDEGAAAYIVKASSAASNDALLSTVRSLLGTNSVESLVGINLNDFLRKYIDDSSRELFLNSQGAVTPCKHCECSSYIVVFSHKTQLPPFVEGKVVCEKCHREMEMEVA